MSAFAAAVPVRASAASAAAPRLTVEAFGGADAFARVEPVWDALVEESGIPYPFVRLDWVRTWWQAFGGGRRLHLAVVRDGARPVALAPLMFAESRLCGLRVRTLQFLANVHAPRFELIVAPGREDACAALWSHLVALQGWDVLQLEEVPSASATVRELRRLAAADGFPVGVWPSLDSPYVSTAGGWDEYLGGLTAKQRANIRNRLRRAERLGAVELETVGGGPGLDQALADGLRLETSSWKAAAGTAIVSRPDTDGFYRALARMAADRGWLRLNFLRVGGKRIAFSYGLALGPRLYLLKVGYDPEWAACSPQNTLCYLVLRALFERGGAELDFLGSQEEWKQRWTAQQRPQEWLFVCRPRLRLRLAHGLKFGLLPALRRQRLYRTLHHRVFGAR
ncbi:MAG TPA: GNAT family N-acetyltransferase [Vicinamibacteria bacterium]